MPVAHGVGRRKAAVARVYLRRGNGEIVVNNRPFTQYFDVDLAQLAVKTPFEVIPQAKDYDAEIIVVGGGLRGQADAVKLGISRALLQIDEALRSELRSHGLLTVDARVKERKKYGQRGARRRFQFVKR
ncbi:TPA: 30S ribosomal protein S9 [Candidatus Dependentiae bacterium]|nr:30S ribosomal protein S9 [Candidatus Dependentiae bacterium]